MPFRCGAVARHGATAYRRVASTASLTRNSGGSDMGRAPLAWFGARPATSSLERDIARQRRRVAGIAAIRRDVETKQRENEARPQTTAMRAATAAYHTANPRTAMRQRPQRLEKETYDARPVPLACAQPFERVARPKGRTLAQRKAYRPQSGKMKTVLYGTPKQKTLPLIDPPPVGWETMDIRSIGHPAWWGAQQPSGKYSVMPPKPLFPVTLAVKHHSRHPG